MRQSVSVAKTKSGRIRVTDTGIAFIALARQLFDMRQEMIDTLIAIERGELKLMRLGCSSLAGGCAYIEHRGKLFAALKYFQPPPKPWSIQSLNALLIERATKVRSILW